MSINDDDILKLDLYEIIGTTIEATETEIKKAYRKKALSCHPDKNPDNPKAAELFLQLSKALEVLTDVKARTAYDNVIKARAAAKKRVTQLDAKRRKLKEDLEAREEAFRKSQTPGYSNKSEEQRFKEEVERLKKEGSKQLKEEQEYLRQKIIEQLKNELSSKPGNIEAACRVKIRWKVVPGDTTNGGYNKENLHRFLSKHGDIAALVISENKKGRALVEFTKIEAAESAVNYEMGLLENPLMLEGLNRKKTSTHRTESTSNLYSNMRTSTNLFPSASIYGTTSTKESQNLSFPGAPDIFNTYFQQKSTIVNTCNSENDTKFEDEVLQNLKRAEERRKLIEKMKAEEEEEEKNKA